MILVKSLLAGASALIVYLLLVGAIIAKLLTPQSIPEDGGVSWNSIWIPMWPILIGGLLIFSAAFYWTFKRSSL